MAHPVKLNIGVPLGVFLTQVGFYPVQSELISSVMPIECNGTSFYRRKKMRVNLSQTQMMTMMMS